MFSQRSVFFRYGFACILLAVATLFRQAIDPLVHDRVPFMAFFPAIGGLAYYFGAGPAAFSTVVSLLIASWFFIQPRHSFAVAQQASIFSEIMFTVTAATFVVFARRMAIQNNLLHRDNAKLAEAESLTRKKSQQFELAAEICELGVCEWDLLTDQITWNKKHFEIYGYEPFSFQPTSRHFLERVHPEDRASVDAALQDKHRKVEARFRLCLPDNECRWVQAIGEYKYDAQGQAISLHGAIRDVTQEKLAFEKLRAGEERERTRASELQALIDAVPAAIWVAHDPDCRVITSNQYSATLTREAPDQNDPSPRYTRLANGRELQAHELPIQIAARTGAEVRNFEMEFRFEDGQSQWVLGGAVPILDASGKTQEVISAFIDITEKKKFERAVARNEERLRAAQKAAGAGVWDWDIKAGTLFWSAECRELFGIAPETPATLNTWIASMHPDDRKPFIDYTERALELGIDIRLDFRIQHPTRGERWIQAIGEIVFDREQTPVRMVGIALDVSERKRSERALAEVQEFNEQLLSSTEDCIKVIDLAGRLRFISAAGLKALAIRDPASILQREYASFWQGADREAALRAIDTAKRGGAGKFEGFCPGDDGKPKWWHVVITPVFDFDGKVEKLLAVSRNITERREADEKITFQAGLLDSVGEAVIATDLCGKVVSWNREAEHLYGWTKSEATGNNILSLTPAENSREQAAAIMEALQGGESWTGEFPVRRADGTTFTAMVTNTPITNASGELIGIVGVSRDVTERKRAERAMQQSEKEFRAIFELSSVGKAQADPVTGQLLRVNRRLCELTGFSTEELLRKKIADLNHPEDREATAEKLRALAEGASASYHLEKRYVRKDQSIVWVLVNASLVRDADDKPLAYIATIEDISDRKESEEALRETRERLQLVLDNAGAYIFYCDNTGRFQFANRRYAERFEVTAESLVGKTMVEVLGQAYESLSPYIARAIRGETMEFEIKVPYEKIGSRYMHSVYAPDKTADGIVRGFIGHLVDVTERRLQEEAHRESEARLRTALDAGQLGTWEWDIQKNAVLWSDRLYEFHGLHPAEFDGTFEGFGRLVHPDDARMMHQKIEASLQSKAPYQFEYRIVRPDGEVRWLYTCARVSFDETGGPVRLLGGTIDLTNRKKVEFELRAVQKTLAEHSDNLEKLVAERTASLEETTQQLEAFCYTVAHDLRAPLRAQQGFAYAMIEEYGLLLDNNGKDYLHRIIKSAAHLNQLVNDLLAYARLSRENLQFENIELTELVSGLLTEHANQIREREARVTRQSRFPNVRGHEITLRLTLENLVSNAMKFVAPGVKPEIKIKAESTGDRVRIWIEDNGIGIAPEHQTQIFGVFHRLHTKAYPGTGIGLALVDKGIQRMGGKVGVQSEPGKGSCFWIELPAAKPA